MLEEIDSAQRQIDDATGRLLDYLWDHPHHRDTWDRFWRAGGVNAADWRRHLRGQPLRGVVRRNGDLRLVVSNSEPQRTRVRLDPDPPRGAA